MIINEVMVNLAALENRTRKDYCSFPSRANVAILDHALREPIAPRFILFLVATNCMGDDFLNDVERQRHPANMSSDCLVGACPGSCLDDARFSVASKKCFNF